MADRLPHLMYPLVMMPTVGFTRVSGDSSSWMISLYAHTLCCCVDPLPQGIIHPIIVKCVAYLNKESVLKEEGLFRIPGDVAVIKRLRERFLAGKYR